MKLKEKLKNMKKNEKFMILAVMALVAVTLGAVFFTQSDMLQGWLKLQKANTNLQLKVAKPGYYNYKDKPVTVVVSAVPSVVPSVVTSPSGPSVVASVVTSPVASGVPVTPVLAAKLNTQTLPALTSKVLKDAAKVDFARNPKKFQLSNRDKQRLIDMYKVKHPDAFNL